MFDTDDEDRPTPAEIAAAAPILAEIERRLYNARRARAGCPVGFDEPRVLEARYEHESCRP